MANFIYSDRFHPKGYYASRILSPNVKHVFRHHWRLTWELKFHKNILRCDANLNHRTLQKLQTRDIKHKTGLHCLSLFVMIYQLMARLSMESLKPRSRD